ncbi:amidohydrolase/deacetylase family metallohydrolase [Muricauda sp. 2012CJ35-5]|uniref:Amidohydrolase/deacetylase family metallohydrolase n=1 Tax=Flagellimonas spongiicola TaxID=2942208 RepID=A0ABT0PUN1_9FLAO|nr:amidohydrolase/deacetylase family metallohydrolase [Allomuricauda spongiicola]MCL6275099.1 amidohydrolase/deacetylase family metallohydrolase [Allomuricauda spongiicola]
MRTHIRNLGCILLALITVNAMIAQEYDLLINDGHVIDVKNGIDQEMDVAILDGKIAKVSNRIPSNQAKKTIEAKGFYVVPGLLDIHTHNFHGTVPFGYLNNSFAALPPDGFTFRSGVTTVADAGSSGWKDFRKFKEQVVDRSKTRVLAFLNIVGLGMKGGAIEQDVLDMDPKLTAMIAKQFPDIVIGIKLAHYSGYNWTPTERAVEAGEMANIPVMIDFGGSEPELPIETLFLEKLRPGDIFTHAYAHVNGRTPIVDENGKVRDYVFKAQQRGIIFDVGHGGGSFLFEQAVPAMQQGLKPNSISTDLHTGSMNGGMKSQINVMSKFLNMNMPLTEVIAASTWEPAKIIQREDLGHLSEGAVADVAILNLRMGEFGFIDVRRKKINGDKKLECELTLREGEVVWDLNGIASNPWNKN